MSMLSLLEMERKLLNITQNTLSFSKILQSCTVAGRKSGDSTVTDIRQLQWMKKKNINLILRMNRKSWPKHRSMENYTINQMYRKNITEANKMERPRRSATHYANRLLFTTVCLRQRLIRD